MSLQSEAYNKQGMTNMNKSCDGVSMNIEEEPREFEPYRISNTKLADWPV